VQLFTSEGTQGVWARETPAKNSRLNKTSIAARIEICNRRGNGLVVRIEVWSRDRNGLLYQSGFAIGIWNLHGTRRATRIMRISIPLACRPGVSCFCQWHPSGMMHSCSCLLP
jgi:hypothetical protein